MEHKVNVMSSKGSLYLPATLNLRAKGIQYVSLDELSVNKIKLRVSKTTLAMTDYRKLLFDNKKLSRQHAQYKNKSLVRFMESVSENTQWKVDEYDPAREVLVLVPL